MDEQNSKAQTDKNAVVYSEAIPHPVFPVFKSDAEFSETRFTLDSLFKRVDTLIAERNELALENQKLQKDLVESRNLLSALTAAQDSK